MGTAALEGRYAANLHGVLSCFDRIIIIGTLPGACYAEGMTSFLSAHKVKIFDYPRFAEPLRERIRERAQAVCAAAGIEIEHVSKSHIRKEDLVAQVRRVPIGAMVLTGCRAMVPESVPWRARWQWWSRWPASACR
jgi:hypothetical protein